MGVLNLRQAATSDVTRAVFDQLSQFTLNKDGETLFLTDLKTNPGFRDVLFRLLDTFVIHGSDTDIALLSDFLTLHSEFGPEGE